MASPAFVDDARRRHGREAWLRWSAAFRNGNGAERIAALRCLSLALEPGLAPDVIVKLLGDPWRRSLHRGFRGNPTGETLIWRHPVEAGTWIHADVRDGRYRDMRFVVDAGDGLPPRLMGVDDYWEYAERIAAGIVLNWR